MELVVYHGNHFFALLKLIYRCFNFMH
uniref:Uncharacterized protein n=1 Tax=Rhizophora mucronata TaxID=61149 RepID=A0A2P2NEM0_RHIMU